MVRFERLVNLTGKPVWVRRGGELVRLDEEPSPTIVEGRDPAGMLVVGSAAAGGEVTLRVTAGVPSAVLFLPAPREGTAFLVDADVVARCGPRDDLFAVDTFGVDFGDDDGDDDTEPGELVTWLASVRQLFPPVPDEAPRITEDDIVAAAQREPSAGGGAALSGGG